MTPTNDPAPAVPPAEAKPPGDDDAETYAAIDESFRRGITVRTIPQSLAGETKPPNADAPPPEMDWPDGDGWWWAYREGIEGGFCKVQRKWNILWLFFAGISESYAKGSKESERDLRGYRFRRAVPPTPATATPQTPAEQP